MFIACEASLDKVRPDYEPLIEAVVCGCRDFVGIKLASIRLMGSVARGDAQPGYSDIDFVLLLSEPLNAGEQSAIESLERELGEQFSLVSRVDIEPVLVHDLHPVRIFILSTDSIVVFGSDAIDSNGVEIERDRLISLFTLDCGEILSEYKKKVVSFSDADGLELIRYSRLTGKDSLKTLRSAVLESGMPYERTIEAIYFQLVEVFPEHSEVLTDLYHLYSEPTINKVAVLDVIKRLESSGLLS